MTTRIVPPPPSGLSPEIAELWAGRAADLINLSGGSEIELARLADVVRLEDRLTKVRAALDEQGPTVIGSQGQIRPHPLLDTEMRLTREIAERYRHLNLTPGPRDVLHRVDAEGRVSRR